VTAASVLGRPAAEAAGADEDTETAAGSRLRQSTRPTMEPMSDDDEAAELGRRARGDIPPRFCTVVDVDVTGDLARIWLLTNDAAQWEEYQVNYRREQRTWGLRCFQPAASDRHARTRL
jgi:hypothetical protein